MFKFLYKLIYGTKNQPLIVSLLLITIFLFVSSVYAWILFNDSVSNSPMNGNTEYDPIKATYEIYYKDQMGQTQLREGFPRDEEDPFEMHTYDSVFVQKNEYNPVILRVIIESPDLLEAAQDNQTKTMTFQITKKTIADSVDENSQTIHGNAWKDSFYFTSVISFAATLEPSTVDLSGSDTQDMENIYAAGYSYFFDVASANDPTPVFKNGITFVSFVKDSQRPQNVNPTNNDKSEVIELSVSYTKNDFREIDDSGVNKLVVYIAMNYDRELLINGGFAAVTLTQGLDILAATFATDLELITIK